MAKQYPSADHKRFQIVSYRPFWANQKNIGESNNRTYAVNKAREWAERYQHWGMTAFVRVWDSQAFANNEEEIIVVFASINGEVVECTAQTRDMPLKVLEEHQKELTD